MAVSTTGFVPNGTRKIRASRGDGVALPSKGNRNSSFLGREWKDETPRFGEVVFGVLKDYYPTPKEKSPVWGGVRDGSPRSTPESLRVDGDRTATGRSASTSKKATRRRTAPPAGRRPSLAAMRAKG